MELNIDTRRQEDDGVEVMSDESVSPMARYMNSLSLNVSSIAVLESGIPIDDSATQTIVQQRFLPINPRFSSIMVEERNGLKKWKRVNIELKNHIHTPTFPNVNDQSPNFYDHHLSNYLSDLVTSRFQEGQPMWEIHIIKYQTTAAAGHLVFKIHQSLGDGYSLMSALLSCMERADTTSLPLTFPSLQPNSESNKRNVASTSIFESVKRTFTGVFYTLYDLGSDVWERNLSEDDISPLRSGVDGVELKLKVILPITFSLDIVKDIKARLKVTLNDVICGVIFYACRLYMEQSTTLNHGKSRTTIGVVLNTRYVDGYKSVTEISKLKSNKLWGNHIATLSVQIPKLTEESISNPLMFVHTARNSIQRKKNSAAVHLIGQLIETIRKCKGPEVAAKYIYKTMKKSSVGVSNVMGPIEQMALAGHPVTGLYFYCAGVPQSITIAIISYAGELRIALTTEKEFIDSKRFKTCIQDAFEKIRKAAIQ